MDLRVAAARRCSGALLTMVAPKASATISPASGGKIPAGTSITVAKKEERARLDATPRGYTSETGRLEDDRPERVIRWLVLFCRQLFGGCGVEHGEDQGLADTVPLLQLVKDVVGAHDGVLQVRIPKRAESKPRRIAIES